MPDAHKPAGQNVHRKSSYKLLVGERHLPGGACVFIVFFALVGVPAAPPLQGVVTCNRSAGLAEQTTYAQHPRFSRW